MGAEAKLEEGYKFADQRKELLDAIAALQSAALISRSGHANLSSRVDEDRILITNSGFVGGLEPDDLVLITLEGKVIEGELQPTNQEIVDMHTELYKLRPEVGSVIHTHSPNLLAFAMANRELPSRYEALVRNGQFVAVPVVSWAPRGTKESVGGIIDAIGSAPSTRAVLLGNHGVLVFAESPRSAVQMLAVLEEAAEAELAAESIGGALDFPSDAAGQIETGKARFS